MQPKYDAFHSIFMDNQLAADAQSGLTDAEGNLQLPVQIEQPHGRIIAANNSDRRMLGIAKLSLVSKIGLEPSSVSTRLASKKGRAHTIRGIAITTRRNNYLLEILSGAKKKWLMRVGTLLWHPEKHDKAKVLLSSFGL
jgi:hypothetical protein